MCWNSEQYIENDPIFLYVIFKKKRLQLTCINIYLSQSVEWKNKFILYLDFQTLEKHVFQK